MSDGGTSRAVLYGWWKHGAMQCVIRALSLYASIRFLNLLEVSTLSQCRDPSNRVMWENIGRFKTRCILDHLQRYSETDLSERELQ